MNSTRPYRMDVRAAAAEQTRDRIAAAAEQAFTSQWYDEITVRAVAAEAGVSLQTVLNHFPSKEALCAAAYERFARSIEQVRWSAPPGDVAGAVDVLLDDYERTGESVLRALAVEERVPALQPWLALGRAEHERWVQTVFRAALEGLAGTDRRRRLAQLVVATDVYTWKLLRRDKGLDREETARAVTELVEALHHPRPATGGKDT